MYKTFGTLNLIAVFSPSLRNVPFSGVEWSYQMKDLGFNEKGVLVHDSLGNDDEEVQDGQGREIEMVETT